MVVRCMGAGKAWKHAWPDGTVESYDWVEYEARGQDGMHKIRLGYGHRSAYGRVRVRVVVWVDQHPHAEFVAADDFEISGVVLSEIRIGRGRRIRMCPYPEELVPERYAGLNICALGSRVSGPGVRRSWAVAVNISDVRAMCALALLRRLERA